MIENIGEFLNLVFGNIIGDICYILLIGLLIYYFILERKIYKVYNELVENFNKSEEIIDKDGKKILDIQNDKLKSIVKEFKESAENGTDNINTEVIIQKSLDSDYKLSDYEKRVKLLPSISIALGLLGTFIGLVGTIVSTNTILGNNMASYEEFATNMSHPFGSMSTAFITSILGVTFSIILNFKNVKLENIKEKFYDLIEDYLDNTIYHLYAKNFTSTFKEFNEVVSTSMMNLTKEMGLLFKDGVEKLVNKINKNTIDLTDMVIAMQDSTKDLERLSKTLNITVENFKKPVEEFKLSMDNFMNTSEDTSESMKESVNKFAINVVNLNDKIFEMNQILDINKTKMENIATSIDNSSKTMKDSYNQASDTMKGINDQQTNLIKSFNDELQNLKNVCNKLSDSLAGFTNGFSKTQETTAENIANIINKQLESIKSEMVDGINNKLKDVEHIVNELEDRTASVGELTINSTDLFSKINNQLNDDKVQDDIVKRVISEKVSTELNSNIEKISNDLNDSVKEIEKQFSKYIESTKQGIDNSINQLNDSIKDTNYELRKSIDDIEKLNINNSYED